MMRALMLVGLIGLSACSTVSRITDTVSGSVGSIGSLGFGNTTTVAADGTQVQRRALTPAVEVTPDPRTMSAQITSAELTPTAQGALLRVSAVPNGGGAFNGELIEISQAGGVLTLALRMQAGASTNAQPQRITLARPFSHTDLRGISEIHIRAAGGTTIVKR